MKYDDTLDVFGVHGVGGILGLLMAGVFATSWLSVTPEAPGISGLLEGNAEQLGIQALGVLIVTGWCVFGTLIALGLTHVLTGLRVDAEGERQGLDLALHGEAIHQ